MGILDQILGLFGKKAQPKALQSASEALQERFEALETPETNEETQPIRLEKDSLQLGIAAGYTGRSLKSIENSLLRIESQMTTKDWFALQIGQPVQDLVDFLKQHEEKEQLRFEALQNTLDSMKAIARISPQPIKSQLFREIRTAESQIPLSPRMKEILNLVKEQKEISYEDLANRFNFGVSGLRGLLTNMKKRTSDIERFEKDSKGWLRYVGRSALNRSQSDGTKELPPQINNTDQETS